MSEFKTMQQQERRIADLEQRVQHLTAYLTSARAQIRQYRKATLINRIKYLFKGRI